MAISDALLDAVLHQESRGDPNALNKRTGAAGIAQIMADTARQPGFGVKPISAKDRFNPQKAIPFARSYLNALSKKYKGNVANTLAAYNWGPGNVDKWLKSGATFDRLPDETRNYVINILGNRGNAPRISRNPRPMLIGQPNDEGGFTELSDEVTGSDLSGVSEDNLEDIHKILTKQEARRTKAEKAEVARQVKALAKRKRLSSLAGRNRPGVQARPNFRPAPSGGGGTRLPPKAFASQAVGVPAVDPLATQDSFIQGLLNPGTEGGLLGARNLGPTGLLRPVPRRT